MPIFDCPPMTFICVIFPGAFFVKGGGVGGMGIEVVTIIGHSYSQGRLLDFGITPVV